MIEVEVESVRISLKTNHRVVILKERHGERYASIWIGQFEAEALAIKLQNTETARPLPYDLMQGIVADLGATVQCVLVTEQRDDVFYATVVLDHAGQPTELDARPSDAINLAIRAGAPVFVHESLLFSMEQFRAMEDEAKAAHADPTPPLKGMDNLDFTRGLADWFIAGSRPGDYTVGADERIKRTGSASGSLRSMTEEVAGFGTLMQWAEPGDFAGKRLRMTGEARAEAVERWAGLWLRIDGVDAYGNRISLSFDNMQNRPIEGTTDWTTYELVLDVPDASTAIAFGILLDGRGVVWLDRVEFSTVSKEVPMTNISTWQQEER